jgi:DNA-binding transcriptional ArsR family regulator
MSLIAAKAQVGVLVAKGQFTEGNGTLISLALDTLMRELSALRPSNVPPQLTFERQPAIETTLPLQGPLGERRAVARSEGKIRRAERTTRKEEILSILRGVAPMNIKEVASKMGNVSEKTVQRELSDLIAEGAVLREGERRWSSYKLATND